MKRLIAVCRSRIARKTPRLNRRLARADIWLPQTLPVIALLGGLLLPYILVWKAGIYHLKDYATFAGWADCWLKDSKNIYLNCHPSPNYPFIGVLASAGALSALKALTGVDDYSEIAKNFHFYLAIFDALNFILLWQLASALKLKHAVWIALLIAALPSSWAGGALWGQIDDVSQFFLLACVLCLVVSIQSADRHQVSSAAYFAGGLLALVALVLTKQLAVFSLAAVAPLVLLACLQLWNSVTKPYGMMVVIATLLLASTLLWFLDSRLEVPPGYYGSSDLFVWLGGGSSHQVNKFSGHGLNIWMFLVKSNPKEPFCCAKLLGYQVYLTPLNSGIALYGSYVIALAAFYVVIVWKQLWRLGHFIDNEIDLRFVVGILLLYIAQVNLWFNVFLTGTHERYLYHCFPFLIIAAFFFSKWENVFSLRSVLLCLLVAIIYGGFVYSALAHVHFIWGREFAAAFSLVLLIRLFVFSFRLLQSSTFGMSQPARVQDPAGHIGTQAGGSFFEFSPARIRTDTTAFRRDTAETDFAD